MKIAEAETARMPIVTISPTFQPGGAVGVIKVQSMTSFPKLPHLFCSMGGAVMRYLPWDRQHKCLKFDTRLPHQPATLNKSIMLLTQWIPASGRDFVFKAFLYGNTFAIFLKLLIFRARSVRKIRSFRKMASQPTIAATNRLQFLNPQTVPLARTSPAPSPMRQVDFPG